MTICQLAYAATEGSRPDGTITTLIDRVHSVLREAICLRVSLGCNRVAGIVQMGKSTLLPPDPDIILAGAGNGVDNVVGDPIGGNSLARATVELTVQVIEKVRAAVFYDTGFVNRNSWDYSLNNVASDVGVGLRLDLPIGPLRLDYGIPIQKAGNPYVPTNSPAIGDLTEEFNYPSN